MKIEARRTVAEGLMAESAATRRAVTGFVGMGFWQRLRWLIRGVR